ncbi:hypothetical protein BG53_14500 [Paenibacillus darwinianus]|uniref:FHA domain-containing protein n=1 Tax=Paenibacillus darwinianus TaxID=1380763 RepID=A0A9W5S1Z0_9BACL|nr:DUF6382 domain-containing protein [Paenibacillus darwinianus]EXX89676.1 hypothetical protein BG52_15020 [Paenibacillus darwinianus]EXX89978.1 hypothetical protein BG53_14500 [Paenibacillus darwinianus]EXX90237.1 hypothetical protein CH50_15990 [Paenibacillus darwinianus]
MEPFKVDFTMQRGHEMLLRKEPELSRRDLDEIDLHMLQAERIPRLLAVDWLDVDGGITFRYCISGRRMVSQKLLSRTLSMTEYYALLLGVVEAVDECRHYLLREACCLLDDKFIYVGDSWDDIRLAYVPLRDGIPGRPLKEALLGLAVRWIARVPNVNGDGLQKVLNILEDTGATLSAVRARLLDLIGQPFTTGEKTEANLAVNSSFKLTAVGTGAAGGDALPDEEGKLFSGAGVFAGKESFPIIQTVGGEAYSQEFNDPDDDDWEPTRVNRADAARAKWLTGAVTAIACAVVWRFVYMAAPSLSFFMISGGLSLVIAWGFLIVWKRLDVEKPAEAFSNRFSGRVGSVLADTADTAVYSEREKLASRRHVPTAEGTSRWREPGSEETPGAFSEAAEKEVSLPEADADRNMPKDETVYLGRQAGGNRMEDSISLLREHAGITDSFPLAEGKLVIGRTAGFSQIVDGSEGVSRTHLEIEQSANKFVVRDLNSRNGSWLNGEQMVPYKSYELKRGDELRLAGLSGPKYALQG